MNNNRIEGFGQGEVVIMRPNFYANKRVLQPGEQLEVRLVGRKWLYVGLPGTSRHWQAYPEDVLEKVISRFDEAEGGRHGE